MMQQKKPNLELAQANIDCQPPIKVYKPHPKKKDTMQRFTPKMTIDSLGNRLIDLGKPEATYKLCSEAEKPDTMIFSSEVGGMRGYKLV